MTAAERIRDAGHDDVLLFDNPSYDDALIGVTEDDRAVYDFDKMVAWLVEHDGMDEIEAVEWIEYNATRALPYYWRPRADHRVPDRMKKGPQRIIPWGFFGQSGLCSIRSPGWQPSRPQSLSRQAGETMTPCLICCSCLSPMIFSVRSL
jgi:hypothetical protein